MIAVLRRLLARIAASFRHAGSDVDLRDELAAHASLLEDDLQRRGYPERDARRMAKLQLGAATLADRHRDIRAWPALDAARRHVGRAWREIRRRPGRSLPHVLTLALGVGLATMLFAAIDATLWHPVPFRDASRIVEIVNHVYKPDFYVAAATRAQVNAWAGQHDLFDWVGSYGAATPVYRSASSARTVAAAFVTPSLFADLGLRAARGRIFVGDDGLPGSEAVLISHRFWWDELSGRRDVIGETLSLDDHQFRIVGVMPSAFRFPDARTLVWIADHPAAPPARALAASSGSMLVPVAHLRALAFVDANAQVRARGDHLNAAAQVAQPMGAALRPFGPTLEDSVQRILWLLAAGVALLVLLVLTNVAAMTLTRNISRAPSFAVQAALGASRGTLVRQVIVEHLFLGLLGSAGGVFVAAGLVTGIVAQLPGNVLDTGLTPVNIDARAIAFAVVGGTAAGWLCGLLPAWQASACRSIDVLQQHGRSGGATSRGRRVRTLLAGAQIALSVVLLAGAGLITRSVMALTSADRGFDPRGLTVVHLGMPTARYADTDRQRAFAMAVTDALRRLPGVQAAAAGSLPPDGLRLLFGALERDDHGLVDTQQRPRARLYEVEPAYFDALRLHFSDGRPFAGDTPSHAVVVSQQLAKSVWPDRSPVGARFRLGNGDWRVVVGVVNDIRHVKPGAGSSLPQIYQRLGDVTNGGVMIGRVAATMLTDATVIVRTNDGVVSDQAIHAAIAAIDGSVVVRRQPADAIVADDTERSRLLMIAMSTFSVLALLIGLTGLFGLLSYGVEQRRREFGIRLALGARPSEIGGSVMRSALFVSVIGLVVGLTGAYASAHVVSAQLYGVVPTDVVTLSGVAAVVLVTASVAAWRPASRAARIDPAALLRQE